MKPHHLVLLFLGLSTLEACTQRDAKGRTATEFQQQVDIARGLFNESCKKAGVSIKRTISNVDGLFLIRLRPTDYSPYRQDADDPYGYDFDWGAKVEIHPYIGTFLTWSDAKGHPVYSIDERISTPQAPGYRFVEAIDPKDSKRYRYVGRYEEPWQYNKAYLKGHVRFVVDKFPAPEAPPRYGITFEDITTPYERQHWIAGSSLKVIDMSNGEVIAERIGYMIDLAQGATPGGRQPWTFAMTREGWSCPQVKSPQGRKLAERALFLRQHDGSQPKIGGPEAPPLMTR